MSEILNSQGHPATKVKLKDIKKMTKLEIRAAYQDICAASREYIKQTTDKFFSKFLKEDRFTISVLQGIINTLPYEYNDLFIKRMGRLANIAESKGYEVKFSKWRTTKQYGWFFVREES